MKLNTNVIDLWTFCRTEEGVRYLLLKTSEEKANKWFNGGRFWQIPGAVTEEGSEIEIVELLDAVLGIFGLKGEALWMVEYSYSIYNRRRGSVEVIPVFAAEVAAIKEVTLSWHHSECGWYTAEECKQLIRPGGMRDGLDWTRKYITEPERELPELKLR